MGVLDHITTTLATHPFEPPLWLRNPHLQTIGSSLWPRDFSSEELVNERRLFSLSDGSKIAGDCFWQPNRRACPTVIALHGLEGSSTSPYMLGIAYKAYRKGFNTIRLNLRNCGGTERLTDSIYHAGQSDDLRSVIMTLIEQDGLGRIGSIGISLGGNICLKLAGEWGSQVPKEVFGVVAVSPAIDLTVSWHLTERWENSIYRWKFVSCLKQKIRDKARLFPDRYDLAPLQGLRTIRQFDERYQTVHNGFRDADDYYRRASAMPFVSAIQVPTLMIQSKDDTIVPVEPLTRPEIKNNPYIITLLTRCGGHVGFIARDRKGDPDCYWAENRAIEFFCLLLGGMKQSSPLPASQSRSSVLPGSQRTSP